MIKCNSCRIGHAETFFCRQCKLCKRTCLCRKRAVVGTVKVPRVNSCAIGSSSLIINSRRAVGLEVELSNFGSWHAPEKSTGYLVGPTPTERGPYYTIDHDGSVHPSRREAVIQPLSGDQGLIQGLNSLAEHVHINGCEVNETCGYHVHVDAVDFYWPDIQKLMLLWLAMENDKGLWKLAGREPTQFSKKWNGWLADYGVDVGSYINANLKDFKHYTIRALYGVDSKNYDAQIKDAKASLTWKRAWQAWVNQNKKPVKKQVNSNVQQTTTGRMAAAQNILGALDNRWLTQTARRQLEALRAANANARIDRVVGPDGRERFAVQYEDIPRFVPVDDEVDIDNGPVRTQRDPIPMPRQLVEKPNIYQYVAPLKSHLDLKANRGWNRAVPSRYLNLNIHSWLYRGTVEYRLGAGTVDPTDIRMWPLFCLWLTEAVAQTSLSIVRKMIGTTKPIITQLLEAGGIMCPCFSPNGHAATKLYPMPDYLRHWIYTKLKERQ